MITWKQLCQQVLTGTAAAVYTAPSLTSAAVHQASAWNAGTSPVAVTIYIVPPNGSAGAATAVWTQTVPAGASAQLPQIIGHKLPSGYAIFAAGTSVTLTISGAESV